MEILEVGPSDAKWVVVLAHGAGQGMESPFMNSIAETLGRLGRGVGGVKVVRFEFPYMAARGRDGRKRAPDRQPVLLDAWRAVLALAPAANHPPERLVIGGKSLGGRMASMIADAAAVAGLICLGYPFHPPGRPDRLRTAHLETLRTPCLICQGERDPFGPKSEVECYRLAPAIRLHWLPDGDHGFKPRKSSGLDESANWRSAVDATLDFLAELDTGSK